MKIWGIILVQLHILIAYVIGYKLGKEDEKNHGSN
jgi:hypothetical protein